MAQKTTSKVEMLVGLKIPDGTALSARQALIEMGYKGLKDLSRYAYYSFEVDGSADSFKKKIANADLLVNANKHTVSFSMPTKGALVVVWDKEKPTGLLSTLKERLGLSEIKSMEAGTLWVFEFKDSGKNKMEKAAMAALDMLGEENKKQARMMTEELLSNRHYQDYRVI